MPLLRSNALIPVIKLVGQRRAVTLVEQRHAVISPSRSAWKHILNIEPGFRRRNLAAILHWIDPESRVLLLFMCATTLRPLVLTTSRASLEGHICVLRAGTRRLILKGLSLPVEGLFSDKERVDETSSQALCLSRKRCTR